ncbi:MULTISPECIES: glycosyltransferase [Proteus]|uniref:Gt1 n=1 Tax=Proteus vulgaris TaxID=585 RepID=A0A385JMP3_PROVU|nr:glycosyltransferase [Proteus vulgaris]AXY99556.1 gt1 [Proteus vulgaris]AYY82553.1 glycosyltransferase [Proteus vulgaris]
MKLLFVITGLGMGGAEVQLCNLADKLQSEYNNNIIIIVLSGENIINIPKSKKIKIINLNIKKNPTSFIFGLIKARAIIKKFKPDIVHSHMFHANIFSRILRLFCKIPVLISTAHSKNEGGKFRMFLYRATDKLATISTNVSQEAVDSFILQKAAPPEKIIAMYNGIDTTLFSFNEIAREKKRAEINLNDNCNLILAVGRLTKAKDYPNLLHAFSKLNLSKKSKLVIIGDGEEKENLQQLACDLKISKDIIWLDIRYDVPDWMSACDLFVLSSAWEGFGLVVAEAMACERLVIGTDSGGVKEVINKFGQVVPPENSIVLSSVIAEYLTLPEHKRNTLGILAREHIIDTFSIEKICQKWLSLYSELLNEHE